MINWILVGRKEIKNIRDRKINDLGKKKGKRMVGFSINRNVVKFIKKLRLIRKNRYLLLLIIFLISVKRSNGLLSRHHIYYNWSKNMKMIGNRSITA